VKGIAYFVRCKFKTRYTHVLSRFIFRLYSGKTFIFVYPLSFRILSKAQFRSCDMVAIIRREAKKQFQSLSISAGWRDKDDRLGPM
jgi:hypothetical protein